MPTLSQALSAIEALIADHSKWIERQAPRVAEMDERGRRAYQDVAARRAMLLDTIRSYVAAPTAELIETEISIHQTARAAAQAATVPVASFPDPERERRARRRWIKQQLADMRTDGANITEILVSRPEWQIELWGRVRLDPADFQTAEQDPNYWHLKRI